jgi:hypothetical protein
MRNWTPRPLLLFLLACPVVTADEAGYGPLFSGTGLLEFAIEAPFDGIMADRPEDEDVPGILRFEDPQAGPIELDVGLRTRGEFRRRMATCPFAPLRVDFRPSQTDGTLFAGQDKLKLVTHCKDVGWLSEQNVLTEYLAYRILNLLTDYSYRVRLVRLSYVYADRDRELVKPAFLIEHRDELAARTGLPYLTIDRLSVEQLEPAHANLVSVFHYLIGNTDFSSLQSSEGEICCHNHTPFGRDDGPVYSIPYDFDFSGIVDAAYAAPNPRFRLRSVRERLYRGRCANNAYLEQSFALLRERRGDIEALIKALPGLKRGKERKTLEFVDDFYDVIDNPGRAERKIVRACL